jgi:hypothetical protein
MKLNVICQGPDAERPAALMKTIALGLYHHFNFKLYHMGEYNLKLPNTTTGVLVSTGASSIFQQY